MNILCFLDDKISHLRAINKLNKYEDNPRGRGNLARQHLFYLIKSGKMSISEFNRRFSSVLSFEACNRGEFDYDVENQVKLDNLIKAKGLIEQSLPLPE